MVADCMAQIWNTHHSRWVDRFWQAYEIQVISTVNWSDESSFEFCFDSISQHQTLTISVSNLRNKSVERRFQAGVDAMFEILAPRLLIVYGKLPFTPDCEMLEFPPDWIRLKLLEKRSR